MYMVSGLDSRMNEAIIKQQYELEVSNKQALAKAATTIEGVQLKAFIQSVYTSAITKIYDEAKSKISVLEKQLEDQHLCE